MLGGPRPGPLSFVVRPRNRSRNSKSGKSGGSLEEIRCNPLASAGADGRFGTKVDKNMPLASARYNATANSVTLRLVQKNIPLLHIYDLSINGTSTSGLQNPGGTFLGGQGVGAPGTNYVQIFSGKILAGPNQLLKSSKGKSAK